MLKSVIILIFFGFSQTVLCTRFASEFKFSAKQNLNGDLCEVQLNHFNRGITERSDWALNRNKHFRLIRRFLIN